MTDAKLVEDLVEHGPCGLLSTTPRGQIVYANATLQGWLGLRREDVAERTFPDLMTVPGKVFWETHFAPLLRMQGFVHEVALDLLRARGAPLPTLVSANEERDEHGAVRSVRIVVYAAPDRRKYERELLLARQMAEQAMKAKADFLAFFAHEVRNPLGAVELAAQSLERAELPAAGQRPLAILQRALSKVIVVLENMLDFSKIEAGKAALDRHRFDLREVVHGAVQMLEPAAEKKGLRIVVEIDDAIPAHLTGDGVKIGQVLTNLVGNAVKFTAAGSVAVACRALRKGDDDVDFEVSVADTGIGIAEDRLAHVFEEFEQAGPDISARFGGTGLGLAISRKIVELHGSTLDVTSAPGAGTKFSFRLTLPIADDEVLAGAAN